MYMYLCIQLLKTICNHPKLLVTILNYWGYSFSSASKANQAGQAKKCFKMFCQKNLRWLARGQAWSPAVLMKMSTVIFSRLKVTRMNLTSARWVVKYPKTMCKNSFDNKVAKNCKRDFKWPADKFSVWKKKQLMRIYIHVFYYNLFDLIILSKYRVDRYSSHVKTSSEAVVVTGMNTNTETKSGIKQVFF